MVFKVLCLVIMGIYVGITSVMVIVGDTSTKRLVNLLQVCVLGAVLYYVWLT